MTERIQIRAWVVIGVMLYLPQADAYLDPVTGSMIIQGLIGAVAGAAVAIKLYWRRLKTWITGLCDSRVSAEGTADEATPPDSTTVEKE